MERQAYVCRKMLNALAKPFVRFVEKFYPDPFIFAALLTFITFIMAFIFTDTTIIGALSAWGNGFAGLMTFIGQLAFTLLATTALANTRPVKKFLQSLANIPNTPATAYALAAFVTAIASWFAWSLGLIAGGILARHIQFQAQKKGLKIHYPLLAAAAYSGFVIWHMGYSGSAQLFVATPGHVFEGMIGVIPVSQTLFAGYNLAGIIFLIITIPALMVMLMPKNTDNIVELSDGAIAEIEQEMVEAAAAEAPAVTVGEKMERMRWVNILIGVLLAVFLANHFATKGLDLNLNIVNWTFLALGILLADSPIHYVKLINDGGRNVGQIILQYPFYAGLMGLMGGTGLALVFSGWFISLSTAQTLPLFTFLSAGILNMFIPSGGGQWSIQGLIFLETARELGVNPAVIVNAVGYGDQWTNMIQPFWTIPILAIAGLRMRDMMGYCFITLMYTGIVFSIMLLFFAS